jgi:Flp pilus assembly protein TadG
MSHLNRCLAVLRRLRDRRDGTVAMIFGLVFIPVLIAAAGIAVDITRTYDARIRLSAALDRAALAVATTSSTAASKALTSAQLTTELNNQLKNYLAANYPSTAIGTNVSATMTDPTQPVINLTATATVPMTFMNVFGFSNITLNVVSQVTKGTPGLELALVLDNTGSMLCGDQELNNCTAGTPPSHITTLISNAQTVVNTIYNNSTADLSKLKIGLVPYVTTVNVGKEFCSSSTSCNNMKKDGNSHLLDVRSAVINDKNASPITFDTTQAENTAEWKGCVIEPTSADENAVAGVTASAQADPDYTEPNGGWTGPWFAFYWPSNNISKFSNGYNHWTLSPNNIAYDHTDGNTISGWDNASQGPNNGCPTPILRLQDMSVAANKTALDNAISGMKAWDAGGTQIHIGMIWGWRMVSPNPPFSDGHAYNTPGWIKAVVLETDGQNELPDSLQLTGLSYLGDGKFGSTNSGTGLTNLNTRLTNVCQNMLNAGIVIYTIGLGATGSSNVALQNCAGNGGKFYGAPTGADLAAAFQSIAVSLNNLRLSK